MQYFIIGLGILCLLYFLVLLAKGVDFFIVWLPAGILLLATGFYWLYRCGHPDGFRIPAVLLVMLGILFAAGFVAFAAVESCIVKTMFMEPEPNLEYVIVLGAQVKGEVPSKALRKRLQAAEKYMRDNPQTRAVLSGGKGDGEDISEAECMYRYLAEAGIEKERLLVEDKSTTTLENLRFSAKVIEEDLRAKGAGSTKEMQEVSAMERKVGILSNNFHVYRAMLLGRKMGYTDFYGVPAGSDYKLQIHYMVREFFALIKEKMMGNI